MYLFLWMVLGSPSGGLLGHPILPIPDAQKIDGPLPANGFLASRRSPTSNAHLEDGRFPRVPSEWARQEKHAMGYGKVHTWWLRRATCPVLMYSCIDWISLTTSYLLPASMNHPLSLFLSLAVTPRLGELPVAMMTISPESLPNRSGLHSARVRSTFR